jgi:hypothetical protein
MDELNAQPAEEITEVGPKHRADAGAWFLALLSTLFAGLMGCLAFNGSGNTMGFSITASIAALVAGGCWVHIARARVKPGALPVCHYALIEQLQFIINRTLNDTAVTAFFRPDVPAPGGVTCLLIFLENYSSRRRHVRIRLSTTAALELSRNQQLNLVVLPGQAAVYRWPLRIYPEARPGDYDITLRLTVKAPRGRGQLLRAASGRKHRTENSLAVSSASFQVQPGFSVSAGPPLAPSGPLAAPAYLSLASPLLAQPRFGLLRQIAENSPLQAVSPVDDASTAPWPASPPPSLTPAPGA